MIPQPTPDRSRGAIKAMLRDPGTYVLVLAMLCAFAAGNHLF